MAVLNNIPANLDHEKLQTQLKIKPGSEDSKTFNKLITIAEKIAQPKALYIEEFIEEKGKEYIIIKNTKFSSRVLRMNLDKTERIFPFIATCGKEVDQLDIDRSDMLQSFWLDSIKENLLNQAVEFFYNHLEEKFALSKKASMNPGSGDAHIWPIEQQKELFSLFGDVESLIGVQLTDSFLMVPNKSVSGIVYPSEIDFKACRLCHREKCKSRSAPFDEHLYNEIWE